MKSLCILFLASLTTCEIIPPAKLSSDSPQLLQNDVVERKFSPGFEQTMTMENIQKFLESEELAKSNKEAAHYLANLISVPDDALDGNEDKLEESLLKQRAQIEELEKEIDQIDDKTFDDKFDDFFKSFSDIKNEDVKDARFLQGDDKKKEGENSEDKNDKVNPAALDVAGVLTGNKPSLLTKEQKADIFSEFKKNFIVLMATRKFVNAPRIQIEIEIQKTELEVLYNERVNAMFQNEIAMLKRMKATYSQKIEYANKADILFNLQGKPEFSKQQFMQNAIAQLNNLKQSYTNNIMLVSNEMQKLSQVQSNVSQVQLQFNQAKTYLESRKASLLNQEQIIAQTEIALTAHEADLDQRDQSCYCPSFKGPQAEVKTKATERKLDVEESPYFSDPYFRIKRYFRRV